MKCKYSALFYFQSDLGYNQHQYNDSKQLNIGMSKQRDRENEH